MVNKIFIWLIQNARPLLGPGGCCKFTISCSRFAILQLRSKPLPTAIWAITRRLISCRPF